MANWPEHPRLIGTRIPRLDGLAKASGKAKYPSDVRPEGTLFGVMLYSPLRPRQGQVDRHLGRREDARRQGRDRDRQGRRATLRYHGDDIAAVAAETEEQARDAVRAIKVEYEVLPHVATEAPVDGRRTRPRSSRGATSARGRSQTKGKPEEAMADGRGDDRGDLFACR